MIHYGEHEWEFLVIVYANYF